MASVDIPDYSVSALLVLASLKAEFTWFLSLPPHCWLVPLHQRAEMAFYLALPSLSS